MMCRTHSSTMQTHKVTVQGHEFEPWILCPLCISFILGGFSLNFGQMFTSVWQCAEPITQPCGLKVKVTVEGHEFEPWFGVGSISPLPLEGFSLNVGQMFASVRLCAEPITQLCWLKSRSQLKVTSLSLEFWGHSIAIQSALLNLGQMFTLVRWCVELITQRCRLKVKVTIEGHPSLSCLLHIS